MVSILSSLGTPWRRTVLGGLKGKLLVFVGGVGIAVPAALLLAHDPAYLPVAVLPLLIVRYLGNGQFYAMHDRARLLGLFEATLDVNRSMGSEETTSRRPQRRRPRCCARRRVRSTAARTEG